jgi:hypothetical protein
MKENTNCNSLDKSLVDHPTNLLIVQLRHPTIFISIRFIKLAFLELAGIEKFLQSVPIRVALRL